MTYDFLIVGAGLTGATCARLLTDAGKRCLVIERQDHVAGNCYDYRNASQLLVNAHGPHYFRTNSPKITHFVQRFADWMPWKAQIQTLVDGRFEMWPPRESYMVRNVGPKWREREHRGVTIKPKNFEEAVLQRVPRLIYERFIRDYTEKQWGVDPSELSVELANRIELRADNDPAFTTHGFQALPCGGYTKLVESMLDGIDVKVGCAPSLAAVPSADWNHLIYTGAIDEFYNYEFGRLRYRGQRREWFEAPASHLYQVPQVNYPSVKFHHLRDIEWKHIGENMFANTLSTWISRETTVDCTPGSNLEYPFPSTGNRELYRLYEKKSQSDPTITFCGRLGRYMYLDMDQAIGQAFMVVDRLLGYGSPKEYV